MILNIILLVIMFVCVAFLWNEGMWSNALSFLNTLLAGMLATNFFEPVADLIEPHIPTYTYFIDFLSLWVLFSVSYLVLRLVTDTLSRHRLRFKMPVEFTGRVVFAVMTAWVFVSFATTTLHTAPLARNSFRGTFQPTPKAEHFFGLAPDRNWLGFVQQASRGSLSHADPSAPAADPSDQGKRVFDPQAEFIFKYAARRQRLAQQPSLRVRP